MKTLTNTLTFVFILGSLNVNAQAFREFTLKKGVTVSELLVEDLNLTGIYGRGRILEKVLSFNNLNQLEARSLPVGTKIKIPETIIKGDILVEPQPAISEVAEAPEQLIPGPESVPKPVSRPTQEESFVSTLSADAEIGWYSYTGKSPEEGSFSASGNYIALNLGNSWKRTRWMYEAQGRAALFCLVCGSANIIIPTFELDGSALWFLKKNLAIGPGAGLARYFYIFGDEGNDERIHRVVPRLFLQLFWQPMDKYLVEAKAGTTWATKVDEVEVETLPFLEIGFFRQLNPSWTLGGAYRYESRKVENFEQTFNQLGLEIKRDF